MRSVLTTAAALLSCAAGAGPVGSGTVIQFHGAGAASVPGPATELVVDAPAQVGSGDVVIASVFTDGTFSDARAIEAGWDPIDARGVLSPCACAYSWFSRIATSTEPTTYHFAGDSVGDGGIAAVVVAYGSVDSSNPVVRHELATPSSAPYAVTDIQASAGEALVATVLAGGAADGAGWVAPSAMSARFGTGRAVAFDGPVVVNGATGSRAITTAVDGCAGIASFVIAPTPSPAGCGCSALEGGSLGSLAIGLTALRRRRRAP